MFLDAELLQREKREDDYSHASTVDQSAEEAFPGCRTRTRLVSVAGSAIRTAVASKAQRHADISCPVSSLTI